MKISHKSRANSARIAHRTIETQTWFVETSESALVFEVEGGRTVVVEGELFYRVDADDRATRFANGADIIDDLQRIYESSGPEGFSTLVEGEYAVAVVDGAGEAVTVFGDAFCRLSLFYRPDMERPVVSTDVKDLLHHLSELEPDPPVLYCLLLLGYPPSKHTPYRGIRRLGPGQSLVLRDGRAELREASVSPLLIREMDASDLDRYGEIVEDAVVSRASSIENWVELSGWDSAVILGVLREHFDAGAVRAVTLGTKCADGRWFYVAPEAPQIAKHFDVPIEYVEYSLADAEVVRRWREDSRKWISYFIYEPPLGYLTMADGIKRAGKSGAAAFIGSFSDSIHDFAFSHFGSLPYVSRGFRDYTSKMRAYMYGPSFLRKVLDGTFEDDFIYKLFKWHCSGTRFTGASTASTEQRIFDYLLSFVLSDIRLPFAAVATDPVFTEEGAEAFKDWLYEHYFKDAVRGVSPENMYFWLIRLYQRFHLQGSEKNTRDLCVEESGGVIRQPYYDLQLVKFAQQMPEDWGRGLEWAPGKFPLKEYGRKVSVPYRLLDSIAHLDTGEGSERSSLGAEVMRSPAMAEAVRGGMGERRDLWGSVFDSRWFDPQGVEQGLMDSSRARSALPLRLWMILNTDWR